MSGTVPSRDLPTSSVPRRQPGRTPPPCRRRGDDRVSRPIAHRVMHSVFSRINRKRPWWKVPHPFQALNLLSLRLDLRDWNLFDTSRPYRDGPKLEPPPEAQSARQPDGRWNSLVDPEMGSLGTPFTRNINP